MDRTGTRASRPTQAEREKKREADKAAAAEALKPVRRKVQIIEEDSQSDSGSEVEFEDDEEEAGGAQD